MSARDVCRCINPGAGCTCGAPCGRNINPVELARRDQAKSDEEARARAQETVDGYVRDLEAALEGLELEEVVESLCAVFSFRILATLVRRLENEGRAAAEAAGELWLEGGW